MNHDAANTVRAKTVTQLTLFLCGFSLALLNFILVHPIAVAFRDIELALVMFTLAYFSGLSLGYGLSDRLTPNAIKRYLPVLLLLQCALMIVMQPLAYVIAQNVAELSAPASKTLGTSVAYASVFVLLLCGGTSLFAVFLPQLIDSRTLDLKRAYSIEVLGSLAGLLAILALGSLSYQVVLTVYFAAFLILCATLGLARTGLAALALMSAAFLFSFDRLDKYFSGWFYRQWYASSGVREVEETQYTPYHKIEVLRLNDDKFMLLLNGQRQFTEGSHHTYSYYLAEYPARLLGAPTTLILGCGSMSTLGRIGSFVPRVKIVDLDERVCAVSQKYFQEFNHSRDLKNWDLQADDAKHFLGNSQERFGLILHDIPPARTRQTALTYTREFFLLVKERVGPGGLFSIASLNSLDPKQRYGKKMLATLASVFDRYFVILYRGSAYFYGGDHRFAPPDKATLFNAIDHGGKQAARVLTQADVEAIVKGVGVITVNNVGELIYD